MSQTNIDLNMEDATRVLDAIIREECKELNGNKDCKYGEIIELSPDPDEKIYKYYIDEKRIKDIITKLGYDESLFHKLLERGLLLRFDNNGEPVYRSVYMDLFIRSVNLRTAEWTPNYVLKPRLVLAKSTVPFSSDRAYRVSLDSNEKEVKELINLLKKELGDENASKFIEIMNAYLSVKGYKGFDLVQLEMIREAIEAYIQGKHIGIEAPTGFGKTEIFLFLILFVLMKNNFDPNRRILVLYPRKSLAIDNANRLILLAKLIEEKTGRKVPILIRIGDSSENPQPKNETKVREGSLRCPNGHELIYSESIAHCSDKGCKYFGSEFYIYDTKKYKILLKNRNFPEPLIIVSNINTVANRLLDFESNSPDMNVEDFKKIHMIVMDEAHVYTNIFGGSTSAVLEGIRTINPETKIVGISATIPNREEFLTNLFNVNFNNLSIVSSVDILKNNKVSKPIAGFKLYLLGLFEIRPDVSWQSYAQLWSVVASTYSLAHLNRSKSSSYQYQNIIFINNVPELNRFREGFEQNLSLGEPCGHVNSEEESEYEPGRITSSATQALNNPFYIFVDTAKFNEFCAPSTSTNSKYYWNIDETLANRSGIVFMNAANKYNAFDKIKKGEWITVASTSSLELGVDYEGVAFVLNAGADDEIEIVQRLGRAGRSSKIPRITLGIIVSKNVPHHSYRINDEEYASRLIYMLSGQHLDPKQRQRIGIHVVKNVRPVKIFRNLLISAIDLYIKGELSDDTIENIKKIADRLSLKSRKSLLKLVNYIEQKGLDSCEDYVRKISRRQKFINESRSYLRYNFERYIDFIEKKLVEIRNELKDSIIEKILGEKEINHIEGLIKQMLESMPDIKTIYSMLKSEIEKCSAHDANDKCKDEIRNIIEKLIGNIQNLDDKTKGVLDRLRIYSNKRYIHQLIDQVRSVKRKTGDIREKLPIILGNIDLILSNISKIKKYQITGELKVLCNTSRKSDLRDLIFGYSSISNVSLNVEDLTLQEIPIKFYEFDPKKNDFVPVDTEEIKSNLFDLLTKFPPFYVFNYAWYTDKKADEVRPRYGVVLLPIDFKKLRWSSNNIMKCFGFNNYTKRYYINAEDIKELKACNILHLEKYLLKGPLTIEPTKDASISSYYIFLKLGATDIRKINNTTYNILDDLFNRRISNLKSLADTLRIRYDVTKLTYARSCMAGNGISTDPFDINCPFTDKCEIGKLSGGACDNLWKFRAKLMPKAFLNFKYRLFPSDQSREAFLTPFLKASEMKSLQIYRDLTSVIIDVEDHKKYIPLSPKIRQILYNTNAIKIQFDKDLVKRILERILFNSSNSYLLNVLLTKYYIYTKGRQNLYRGVRELRKPENFEEFVKRIHNDHQERDGFLDFAFAVLLHTLAHLFYEFVTLELKLDENLIDYYYDFENYDNAIYVYEKTSEGALNLSSFILRTFRNNFNSLVTAFLEFVYKKIKEHDKFITLVSSNLKNSRNKVMASANQSIQKALKKLDDILDNKFRKVGIEPDVYTMKIYVTPEGKRKKGKSKKRYSTVTDPAVLGSLVDIALGNFCVDGCSSCVIEDSCHYPLIQNIITSRNLVEKFITQITNTSGTNDISIGLRTDITIIGNSDFGFSMIRKFAADQRATKLSIETAYFDENCLKVIEEIMNENPRLQVTLTVDSRSTENIVKLKDKIEKLEEKKRFEFKKVDGIHTKVYVVDFDDGTKITMTGSWNCQQSSSKQNFTISLGNTIFSA